MHEENHYYGHVEVLAACCGLRAPRLLAGHLQHGWQPGTGIAEDCWRTRWPKLVWSRRNLRRCAEASMRAVVPVGAPFLYLPPPADGTEEAPPSSLLAFPFHGWSGAAVGSREAAYEEYASSLERLREDGHGPVTVCLYWLEHEEPRLRSVFERRGFEVRTAGHGRGDIGFLDRLRALILSHARVTANRIATCAFYALHLRRPFFLYGPAMRLEGEGGAAALRFREWEDAEFGVLRYERFDGGCASHLGDEELGLEFRLSPEALRETLGWSGAGYLTPLAQRLDIAGWVAVRALWRLLGRRRGR